MRESEVHELIQSYMDPAKRKRAEELSREINGEMPEINAFLHNLQSASPKVKEISSLFLRHSLVLAKSAPNTDRSMFPSIFVTIVNNISPDNNTTDRLLYESVSSLADTVVLSDILPILQIDTEDVLATIKVLNVLARYTQKYATLHKSDWLYTEIIQLLSHVQNPFYKIVQYIIDTNMIPIDIYTHVYTIIYHILIHDIPDYFEENIGHFTKGLFCISSKPQLRTENASLKNNNNVRAALLIQIKMALILLTKYTDVYEEFSIFTESLDGIYSRAHESDEGVQIEFMHYLRQLLQITPPNTPQHLHSVLRILLSKIHPTEMEGKEFLYGDPAIIQEISAGIIKDLLDQNATTLQELIAQNNSHCKNAEKGDINSQNGSPTRHYNGNYHSESSLYLVLYLMRCRFRLSSPFYSHYVEHAVSILLANQSCLDTHELPISMSILVLSIQHGISYEYIQTHTQQILQSIDSVLASIDEDRSHLLYLAIELLHTIYVYHTEDLPYSPHESTIEKLFSIFQQTNNEQIESAIKGLFLLMRMDYTSNSRKEKTPESTASINRRYSNVCTTAYYTLINSSSLSCLSIRYLYNIVALDIYYQNNPSSFYALLLHSIQHDIHEYNTYNILILSIVNILYDIPEYKTISDSILNNSGLYSNESLAYLFISHSNQNYYNYAQTTNNSSVVRALVKYGYIYNCNYDNLLIRYVNGNDKSIVDRFIGKTSIAEEDTKFAIEEIEKYIRENTYRVEEMGRILEKVKKRRVKRKEEKEGIDIIEEIVSKYKDKTKNKR
ncbi:hypothetical protein NEAUS06_1829 [Nematocida ausubeli]|nr:hypothetical protein NEAUS06_1829 [Nematocida ausubeli]